MNKLKTNSVVIITENAANRLKSIMSKKSIADKDFYIKIGVKRRGCNGLSYTMNYVNEKDKFDEEVEKHGVKLLIDNKALMYLIGTKMDYVEDEIKSEFIFVNPNSKGSCGCGESFNV